MNATVWVDATTRDRLKARKNHTGAASVDAVIRSLLDASELSVLDVFRDRATHVRSVCRNHGVARLVAFGSRARRSARTDSDLDLAYDVNPARRKDFDLFDHIALQDDLSKAFGLPVDIVRIAAAPAWLVEEIKTDGVELLGRP